MKRYLILNVILIFMLAACELPNSALTAVAQTQTAQSAMNLSFVSAQQQTLTAIAQTQVAQDAAIRSQQQTQTALALTQVALSGAPQAAPLAEQQIQTAIALTQAAQSALNFALSQTQTALALPPPLQATPTPAELAPAQTQAALMQTQAALAQTLAAQNQPVKTGPTDFTGATIYKYGFPAHEQMMVTIQLNSIVQGGYHAFVNGQLFKCWIVTQYPDRLYCQGKQKKGGYQDIQVFEDGTEKLVFEAQFELPVWTPTKTPLPTPKHGYTPTPWHKKPTKTPTP